VHSNESKTTRLTDVNKNARLGGISESFFRIPSPPAAVRSARKRVAQRPYSRLESTPRYYIILFIYYRGLLWICTHSWTRHSSLLLDWGSYDSNFIATKLFLKWHSPVAKTRSWSPDSLKLAIYNPSSALKTSFSPNTCQLLCRASRNSWNIPTGLVVIT
jgi:hypothetical protein